MIAIVGGTGMLGRALSRMLLDQGERVRIMTRDVSRAEKLNLAGAEIVRGDLRNPASLTGVLEGARVVISASHSILGRGGASSAYVDGEGQRALIAAARSANVSHFVYTSALGASPEHPVDFWRTKAEIEGALRESGLPCTIVRPSAFIEMHAWELLGKAVTLGKRVPVFGPGTNPRNFVAVRDVAQVIVHALRDLASSKREIEVGGPDNPSTLEVVRIFEEASGKRARIMHVPLAVPRSLAPAIAPFHSGVARIMKCAVVNETTDQTFNASSLPTQFGFELTSLRAWAATNAARA